jgi:hypothetical protein
MWRMVKNMSRSNMRSTYLFLLLIALLSCKTGDSGNPLHKIIDDIDDKYPSIIYNVEEYGLQIIYTQIDRDKDNQPHLLTWQYNVDVDKYFYPASTVKLPAAILALEKINDLNIPGLKKGSTMFTDSAYSGQTRVYYDSSAQSLNPSISHYIKKIFLVSDNDAFNRLYEFLGQEYSNEMLKSKGFVNTGIIHRLSIFLSEEENRHTNPVRFFNGDTLVYKQAGLEGPPLFPDKNEIFLGEGYMTGDSLIQGPMDFTRKNFMSLEDLHNILIELILPGVLAGEPLYNLKDEDYDFLYRYMSMYPRESEYPYYGTKYEDRYCKFLMYADHESNIPGHIRIFNKIGLAYGFLIETAYIIDIQNNIEFFLSTVLNVNLNKIYNDGIYEYDSIGFPFFADLGKAVYHYELNRPRKHTPDLSSFTFEY